MGYMGWVVAIVLTGGENSRMPITTLFKSCQGVKYKRTMVYNSMHTGHEKANKALSTLAVNPEL